MIIRSMLQVGTVGCVCPCLCVSVHVCVSMCVSHVVVVGRKDGRARLLSVSTLRP